MYFSTGRGGDFVESAGIFLGLTSLKIFMQNGIPSFSLELAKRSVLFLERQKKNQKKRQGFN
ncbi:MAG: hypothetical protein D4R67_09085 [Bacteroidetes bacterium]|nr:MAG: hypothetical protein D4R67_09085 [Bacteroidota bacterium]